MAHTKERKQDRDDAAVGSVLTAVNSTKSYTARLDRGEPVDYQLEAQLAALWTTATFAELMLTWPTDYK